MCWSFTLARSYASTARSRLESSCWISPRTAWASACFDVTLSAVAATAVSATADSVTSKQAEAQAVLGEIQQLDSSLERAVEAYDLANVKLQHIKHDLSTNTHNLVVAKRSLKASQRQLSARLVELYTSSDQDSTLAVLLRSSSLDHMLTRIDPVDRVDPQDALVLSQ